MKARETNVQEELVIDYRIVIQTPSGRSYHLLLRVLDNALIYSNNHNYHLGFMILVYGGYPIRRC